MARKDEIAKAASKCWVNQSYNLTSAFTEGAVWADKHSAHNKATLVIERTPWKSVKDEPPEDKQKVVMRKRNGKMYVGHYDNTLKCFLTVDPTVTTWTINGVTHWMPLQEVLKRKKTKKQ